MAANVITNLEKQMPFIKAAGKKYATVRPAPAPIYSPNSPPFTKWTELHSYNLTRRAFWLTSTARRMRHSGQQSAAQSSLVDLLARSVTVTKRGKGEKGGMNERVKWTKRSEAFFYIPLMPTWQPSSRLRGAWWCTGNQLMGWGRKRVGRDRKGGGREGR